MTNHFDIDLENADFADMMIQAIERDYGRSIARIPYFEKSGQFEFELKVVFTDFRLLEATISILPDYVNLSLESSTIQIEGTYY
jgi:hypothetical protein